MRRIFLIVLLLWLILLRKHESFDQNSTTGEGLKGEEAEVIASTVSLESAFKGFKGDDNKFVKADEQTRVDTLVRALKRLPEGELSHYGLTASQLEQTFTPGTQETDNLFKAWTIRQEELKKAVESMVKPAEYMEELVEYIVPSYSGLQKARADEGGRKQFLSKVDALEQLESLVEDIDNARDFKTIGGFGAIVSALINPESEKEYSLEERSLAASVIGNAVKSDYDFQLWVLEDGAQCLRGLLSMLHSGKDDVIRRRALYALASASRGNSDVQEALLDMDIDLSACLMNLLTTFTKQDEESGGEVSVELARKALAYVSDMLSEYAFLQEQIKNPKGLDLGPVESVVGADGAMTEAALAGELMSQLHAIRPIGPSFCSKEWKILSIYTLDKTATLLFSFSHNIANTVHDDTRESDSEQKKDNERGNGKEKHKWMRSLLSNVKGTLLSRQHKPDVELREIRASVAARRGALDNALSVFLQSSNICDPVGYVYSSTEGSQGGPGAVVASAKASLEQAQAWALSAGDLAGELPARISEALRFID